jgi:hypothetical protein
LFLVERKDNAVKAFFCGSIEGCNIILMVNQKVIGRSYKSFGVEVSLTILSRRFLGKRGGNLSRIIGFGEYNKDIFSEREVGV